MDRDALIAALAEVVRDLATGSLPADAAAGRLLSIAETVSGGQLVLRVGETPMALPPTNKKEQLSTAIQTVFEQWRRIVDKPKATLTQERASKIRARLGEGRTVKDLVDAVNGAMLSEHHVANDHLDVVTIFKNATTTEQHLDRLRGSGAQQRTESIATNEKISELKATLARAKEMGDVETYNRIRQELQHELRQQR